jgi:hypothetical protein
VSDGFKRRSAYALGPVELEILRSA